MFKSLDEYHVDLSASSSTLNIPLESLILTYQQISTTALRITIAAKDTSAPVLTDIRRITIFNTSSIESLTLNNRTISTRTVLDDLMYTQSQESHCLTIRQQNPITKLWSLCEIHSFSSNGGARILSESIAGLPVHVYKYTDSGSKEKAIKHPLYRLIHDEPNPEMTYFVFRETLMTHLF